MPFASDKQRRYLWSQKPEVAKQIAYKQDGGLLDGLQRPEINNLEDLQRVANARNQELAAVAAELGISPQDLADVQGSSADQANDIARQIWGDNAPQLRQSSGAAETAGEMAGVLAELAKQNPGAWGNKAPANSNALEPAKPQGFFDWAGEQLGEAADSAGTAFGQGLDYVTGEAQRNAENEAYNQKLENMTPEELVEHLNQKYPSTQQAVPPADAPPQQRSWKEKATDAFGNVVGALNPISDANAMDARSAIGLAGVVPNPTLANAPVFQGGLNVGGLMGISNANASPSNQGAGQGYTPDERIRQSWSGATDDNARQTWKKGWFSDGFETETPQDIRARQAQNMQAFEQHTGFNMPHQQETFLHDRFGQEAQGNDNGWQDENRGYFDGGWQSFGEPIQEREVTYADGAKANAATAQGDWEIQAILNNPEIGMPSGGFQEAEPEPTYSGWDDGGDDDDWDDDFGWDGGGSYEDDVESDVGTNTYASPYEQGQQDSGGGDDGGGGGGK